VKRSFNYYRDFALDNLGYTSTEADEYARTRIEEQDRKDNGAQLALDNPPADEYDPATAPWPEGF
jgi:hypothetical protein